MNPSRPLSWIQAAPDAPYFQTEWGEPWMPVGQNDSIAWDDLKGAFRRKDMHKVEAYFRMLRAHGVACMRLMLEYSQGRHRYFEKPCGVWNPNVVRMWDGLFALAERHGIRFLLTPYDTYWMWRKWAAHPYNRANGGPCAAREQLLLCPETRRAMKARLEFATRRWGASGAVFAWDLWNEIHPAHAGNSAAPLSEFIADVGGFMAKLERGLHGRAHPRTVSVFAPHVALDSAMYDCVYRHPALDFASTHFYAEGAIDNPRNTVDAAVSTGRLMRDALAEIRDRRPFFDSEHGPIHRYKDGHRTLPAPFDDEYFRHMQWAHFASGGAGGGMRWPNRVPHTLTIGMRAAQRGLACFLPLIDWNRFRRRNWNEEVACSLPGSAVFACGDESQAVVWLLRRDTIGPRGMVRREAAPVRATVRLPMPERRYRVTAWNTRGASAAAEYVAGGPAFETPPFVADLALAVRRA